MIRVAIIICAVVACGPSRGTTPSGTAGGGGTVAIAVDTDRFPHGVHTGDRPEIRNWQGRGLGCVDCHDKAAVIAGKVARPGGTRTPATNQHAPCDDCHEAEFMKPPGALCRVCHVSVDPFKPGNSPMQPYPERGATQTLASTFSHQLHLDKDKMERASGAHVGCTDCHDRDAQSRDPQVPGHRACARCHEESPKVKAVLPMASCARCHPQRKLELKRGRRFIIGDLKFAHATHEKDRSGNPIACTLCHDGVDDSATREDMAVPAMERCAQCHEDSGRSPDRVRMDNCSVCHGAVDIGSAPANHLVSGSKGGSRPADHTLHFRKHHAEQAAAKDSACRRCHTELQGNREDTCFQCHQVMRPRDHNLMWRQDHGRDAQTDGTRCAQCHAPETCVSCHSIPPRSHTPLGEFRQGGHAELARFGLSSCLTCHTYEDTCIKCHRGVR